MVTLIDVVGRQAGSRHRRWTETDRGAVALPRPELATTRCAIGALSNGGLPEIVGGG
jgi:hypothetical protein